MWLLEMFDADLKPVLSYLGSDKEALLKLYDNAIASGAACLWRLSRQTDQGWQTIYQSVELLPF